MAIPLPLLHAGPVACQGLFLKETSAVFRLKSAEPVDEPAQRMPAGNFLLGGGPCLSLTCLVHSCIFLRCSVKFRVDLAYHGQAAVFSGQPFRYFTAY